MMYTVQLTLQKLCLLYIIYVHAREEDMEEEEEEEEEEN